MARGHFADKYSAGGELLGKGGAPLATTPVRGAPVLHPHAAPASVQHMDDGELAAPLAPAATAPPVAYEFYCDITTWQRNVDGWASLAILNAFFAKTLGQPISVVLTEEEARNGFTIQDADGKDRVVKLPSDVRWHFKKRPARVVEGDDVG